MIKPLSLFIAFRYITSKHKRGFSAFISASSTLGIALGVMVLIIGLSAMNGFERALAQKLLSIVPHAELVAVNEPIENWPKNIKRLQNNPDVVAAAPVIQLKGMIQHKLSLKAIEVRGVEPKLETLVSDIKTYMIEGEWSSLAQNNTIIIGHGIAKNLGVKVGDTVQILLPPAKNGVQQSGNQASRHTFAAPLKRNVQIGGIFKFGGTIDETLSYISFEQATKISGYELSQTQGIRLKVADVYNARHIAKKVAFQFNHYVYIIDWSKSQGHLFNDIQLVRLVMFIVLILVIAVASFNIVSTLIMSVNEKKSDIAILSTMGASSSLIMITFILQGLFNGVLGCLLGAISGVYLANNLSAIISAIESFFSWELLSADVYFVDHIPSHLIMADVYSTVLVALVLSFLATLYPAWRATKIEPAQVLGQL
ncbi:MAG: lipoprotein-releasing ABC transporter permease subunit LolE [Colwellia sp.]